MSRKFPLAALCVATVLCSFPLLVVGQECSPSIYERVTDDYFFTASSAQGAVGDIVAVDVVLTVEALHAGLAAFQLVACYDAELAEFLDPPEYSPGYGELVFISHFSHVGGAVGPQRPGGGRGLVLYGNFDTRPAEDVLSTGEAFPFVTFYFRLKGSPGNAFDVSFCDREFVHVTGACVPNNMYYVTRFDAQLEALSTRHVPGMVRILPGEATQTERPSVPPEARVYPEAPSAAEAAVRFELTGGLARPGARDVPMELYITSALEFSGFSVSLLFPWPSLGGQVELTRIEEHTRPALIDVEDQGGAGHARVGMVMANSRRRLGAEGERVHLATLRFDVREDVGHAEVAPRFEDFLGYSNWVAIHHEEGVHAGALSVVSEVTPLEITSGVLAIRAGATRPGDVNEDGEVNITDAIVLLEFLFLGARGELSCPPAVDFNADGRMDLSDPVAILNHLFLGAPEPLTRTVECE